HLILILVNIGFYFNIRFGCGKIRLSHFTFDSSTSKSDCQVFLILINVIWSRFIESLVMISLSGVISLYPESTARYLESFPYILSHCLVIRSRFIESLVMISLSGVISLYP